MRVWMIKEYFQSLYENTKMEVVKEYMELVDGKDAAFIRAIADNIKSTFERNHCFR